ncbi:Cation transporter family protein [Necator americanus]|uniref:Cation transporter family protein n=1 Tax=Necator americanus TaxID=51031 RepID=W2TVU6_NECAM|nr:Cation transporter family protein [Necator americanus]ETN85948.1 Cation transporter family protein [Necator americanus]
MYAFPRMNVLEIPEEEEGKDSILCYATMYSRKVIANNVTTLLNQILQGYDRHLRPGFNMKRTTVFIDIFVRTMGPIADLTDTYSFNCYFRQMWTDSRLKFNGTQNKQLSLSMAMLDKIWKPDTYFWNGARSYTHTMTTSNRLVRLYPDGTVLYSSRLTIKGKCAMSMKRYPLDRQACRLVLGSYAFGSDELLYDWRVMGTDRGVQMDYDGIKDLPQFSMTGFQVFNSTNMTRDRNYSALEVRFYFDRHFGYFLMNFYVPCTLIVLLCWVAFWTNREATGDRVGMGITSVLTMVLIANDSKSDAPKVNFPTALDIYIWICYTTLLICMVEFTVVHYFTKFNTGDPEIQALEREKMRQIIRRIPKTAVMSSRRPYRKPLTTSPTLHHGITRRDGGRHSMYHRVRQVSVRKRFLAPQHSICSMEGNQVPTIEEFQQDSVGWRLYYWMMNNGRPTDPFGLAQNSISSVDRFSRIALPIYFVAVVIVYYNFYVNTPYDFTFDDEYIANPINPM